MLRRSLAAGLVMFVIGGFVLAETYRGTITSLTKDEVKITVRKDKEDKEGTPKTFKVAKDVKIQKSAGKDKEATDAKMEDLTKAVEKAVKADKGPKGVIATIETQGSGDKETATKITFRAGGKRKQDK
jgi:hypothetical protein